jgi:hypothetical protein
MKIAESSPRQLWWGSDLTYAALRSASGTDSTGRRKLKTASVVVGSQICMSTSFNMFLGSQLFDTTSTEKSRRSELAVGWKVHSFILLLHAARQLAVGNRGIPHVFGDTAFPIGLEAPIDWRRTCFLAQPTKLLSRVLINRQENVFGPAKATAFSVAEMRAYQVLNCASGALQRFRGRWCRPMVYQSSHSRSMMEN